MTSTNYQHHRSQSQSRFPPPPSGAGAAVGGGGTHLLSPNPGAQAPPSSGFGTGTGGFSTLERSQRSKSLDNRRDFWAPSESASAYYGATATPPQSQPRAIYTSAYAGGASKAYQVPTAAPIQHSRQYSGSGFFNDTFSVPIQKVGASTLRNSQIAPPKHYRSAIEGLNSTSAVAAEQEDEEWQSFDRKVTYNHERTILPVVHSRRHHSTAAHYDDYGSRNAQHANGGRYAQDHDYNSQQQQQQQYYQQQNQQALTNFPSYYDDEYNLGGTYGRNGGNRAAGNHQHHESSAYYHRESAGGGGGAAHAQHAYQYENGYGGGGGHHGAYRHKSGYSSGAKSGKGGSNGWFGAHHYHNQHGALPIVAKPKRPVVHHKFHATCEDFISGCIINDDHYGYCSEMGDNERYTMAEFAVRFFRRPKHLSAADAFSLQRKKKEWTWKEITDKVKFIDHTINHSLLRLESAEADKLAVDAFVNIQRYMGDETLKRSQTLTDCVYELLSICYRYGPIRDEVYCQLLKQLTANRSARSADSQVHGWRLLTIVTAYFACSNTLKPYLVKYLADIAYDERRNFHGIAKQCLYHLAQSFRYGGRRFILGAAEVEAITNGKNIRRQVYHLPGGHRRIIFTRAVTVAEQVVQELCMEMNVKSVDEQQEFTLCYILEKDNTMKTLNNDEYILDVITELEARDDQAADYILILTRSVWIHPLRQDNRLYTDALFFQIMPNYIAGLLTSLVNGNVSAATLRDVTHLGALLLLSDPLISKEDILLSNIDSLVPKTILRYGNLSAEQWLKRIDGKVRELLRNGAKYSPQRARQEFLEIVSKWPLFGAVFFFVRRVITKRQNIVDSVVAINKQGVRILTSDAHECLAHYPLDEIETTNKYSVSESHFLEVKFTAFAAQKYGYDVFTVETELGIEVARVIGQYLYLCRDSKTESIYVLSGNEVTAGDGENAIRSGSE